MTALLLLILSVWTCAGPVRYELDLSVSAEGAFQGQARVTFPCPGETDFVFRLYPNHFGPFLSVTGAWVDGLPAAGEALDPTVLVVLAPHSCRQTVSVSLEFAGKLPNDPWGYGIFWRQERTMSLAQFYPILAPWREGWVVPPTFSFGDNLVADVADYVLTVRVPPGWRPVGSGREEELTPGLWRLEGRDLREMGLVLVRGFAERGLLHPSGVELRVVYPPEVRSAADQALRIASEALTLFTRLLGPHPYPDLDLVFVSLVGAAGVEYPRLIYLGWAYAWDPGHDFFAEIVVHELAHQWWYGEVGTNQVAEPWLDEGLATYTSGLYFEAQGKLPAMVARWKEHWEMAKRLFPQGNVGSALWDFSRDVEDHLSYSGYVYSGAALFLHEVRTLLGDTVFFDVLRRFRAQNRWGLASAAQLLAMFQEEAGPSFETLWAKYFGP